MNPIAPLQTGSVRAMRVYSVASNRLTRVDIFFTAEQADEAHRKLPHYQYAEFEDHNPDQPGGNKAGPAADPCHHAPMTIAQEIEMILCLYRAGFSYHLIADLARMNHADMREIVVSNGASMGRRLMSDALRRSGRILNDSGE